MIYSDTKYAVRIERFFGGTMEKPSITVYPFSNYKEALDFYGDIKIPNEASILDLCHKASYSKIALCDVEDTTVKHEVTISNKGEERKVDSSFFEDTTEEDLIRLRERLTDEA